MRDNADRIERANNRGTLPYFPKDNANFAEISVKDINLGDRAEYIRKARAKYDSYDDRLWRKKWSEELKIVGFDEDTGGYVVVHKGHRFDINTGEFEVDTVNILVKNGYWVEMKDESNYGVPQYDMDVNGFPTEIKVMSGFRNIHKRAEDASNQGAKRIIYYIRFDNPKEMGSPVKVVGLLYKS